MACICASKKLPSAQLISAATQMRSAAPPGSPPKRWRIQSPGVTNPLRLASGRNFGARM